MTAGLRPAPVAGRWSVSDSRTRVTFTVGNLGRPVHGSVAVVWGEVEVAPTGAPVSARAEFDLGTIDTGIARRDADLRAPRFLDIDRHPVMSWSADRFRAEEDGAWTAVGTLRLRGESAPLAVTGRPELADGVLRIRATAQLDRTAVGIRAPRVLVGRLVTIEVDAVLAQPR
ncbi:YceI family protein [Blastococcus sp. SYSU D00820]